MRTKTWLLAAGAAATVIVGGSGIALATAAPSDPAIGQCAAPKDPNPGVAAAQEETETFFTEARIALLASELGISGEQAHQIGGQLEQLAAEGGGGITPTDPAFVAIAESVGKTGPELKAALDPLKPMAAPDMPKNMG